MLTWDHSERSLWRLALRLASFSSASSSCVNATRWSDSSPTHDNAIEMRSRVSLERRTSCTAWRAEPIQNSSAILQVPLATQPQTMDHTEPAPHLHSIDDGRSIIATDLSSRTDGRNSYDLIHRLALLGQDREGVLEYRDLPICPQWLR